MKAEWRKFDPRYRSTHPKDNSRVLMKRADGSQVSGGYAMGRFHYGGAVATATADQTKRWRYAD
jgi:hypothetical protein